MERDPLDVAWAAGLFEGEGCLTMTTEAGRKRRHVQARLGSTDRDVVERFAAIIGFGNIHLKPARKEHWKDLHEWATQSAPLVREFIELMLPHLGQRRTARAEAVYEAALAISPHSSEATHCPQGHAYTPQNTVIERRRGDKTVRRCRICRRADSRRWEAGRRAISRDAPGPVVVRVASFDDIRILPAAP